MTNLTGQILKGNEVELQGRFVLGSGPAAQNQINKKPANSAPQARIVQNSPEFVIVEVTCPCGTKTNIKCEYNTLSVK